MKKSSRFNFSIACVLLINNFIFGQEKITPQIEQKIKQKVEIAAQKFKFQYRTLNKGYSDDDLEFAVDTFKIERTLDFSMDYDYTTSGMNKIVSEATDKYDILLNKYYQKLLTILQGSDKQVLIEAQREWLKFRDLEIKLVGTLSAAKYSGGGTMQSNINVGEYSDFIKSRTIKIFQYYLRAKGF